MHKNWKNLVDSLPNDDCEHIIQLYQCADKANGLPEASIADAEKRLNLTFPAVLRHYLRMLGGDEAINQSYNRLLALDMLTFDGDYLPLFEENQGVCYWGIKKTDLMQENPPAYIGINRSDSPHLDWLPHLPSISALLLEMACYNATMGGLRYCANLLEPEHIHLESIRYIQQNRSEIEALRQEQQRYYTDDFHEIITLCFSTDGKPSAVFIGTAKQTRFDALLDIFGWENWSYISYEDEDEDET